MFMPVISGGLNVFRRLYLSSVLVAVVVVASYYSCSGGAGQRFASLLTSAHEVPQNVDRHREDDGRVLLVPYAAQSLQDGRNNIFYTSCMSIVQISTYIS